jgi:prepilin-type N-terminal cleavage/methylation domain-containing protein
MTQKMNHKILNTNSGFSILEVMIAAAIVAVGMLAVMQVGTGGATSGKSNTLDLDFAIIASNLQTTLSTDCTGLLNSVPFNSTAPSPNPVISNLAVGGFTIAAIPSASPLMGGLMVTNISINQLPVPVGSSTPAGNVEYQTNFHIEAKKLAIGGIPLPGAPFLHKDFPITVWASPGAGGSIVACAQETVPTGAFLNISAGTCSGTNDVFQVSWGCTNPTSVSSAQLVVEDNSSLISTPYPLPSPGIATPIALPSGSYGFTLLLTDFSGVQSFGTASPSPSPVSAPPCP